MIYKHAREQTCHHHPFIMPQGASRVIPGFPEEECFAAIPEDLPAIPENAFDKQRPSNALSMLRRYSKTTMGNHSGDIDTNDFYYGAFSRLWKLFLSRRASTSCSQIRQNDQVEIVVVGPLGYHGDFMVDWEGFSLYSAVYTLPKFPVRSRFAWLPAIHYPELRHRISDHLRPRWWLEKSLLVLSESILK